MHALNAVRLRISTSRNSPRISTLLADCRYFGNSNRAVCQYFRARAQPQAVLVLVLDPPGKKFEHESEHRFTKHVLD